jgi:excisionase family DNA binding protein
MNGLPLYLSPTRAAEWSGISRERIYELVHSGAIAYIAQGNRFKVSVESLTAYLKRIEIKHPLTE